MLDLYSSKRTHLVKKTMDCVHVMGTPLRGKPPRTYLGPLKELKKQTESERGSYTKLVFGRCTIKRGLIWYALWPITNQGLSNVPIHV